MMSGLASTVIHPLRPISSSSWPRGPAAVAQRDQHAARAGAAGQGFEHVARGRHLQPPGTDSVAL